MRCLSVSQSRCYFIVVSTNTTYIYIKQQTIAFNGCTKLRKKNLEYDRAVEYVEGICEIPMGTRQKRHPLLLDILVHYQYLPTQMLIDTPLSLDKLELRDIQR